MGGDGDGGAADAESIGEYFHALPKNRGIAAVFARATNKQVLQVTVKLSALWQM